MTTLHDLYIDLLIQIRMQSEFMSHIYSIGAREDNYEVREIEYDDFYTAGKSCRKAYVGEIPDHSEGIFRDLQFMINLEELIERDDKGKYAARRIYELYDKEFQIFSEEYFKESHLELTNDEEDLPTFLSQFSMIDRQYIKTRFFTKTVNAQGYYQYFVRRNGEYFVEFVDDMIPVQGSRQMPLWGLTLKEPWKIIIMKAWIKEKKGINGVMKAEPYEFIEAFGLPGYRALSIKKEVNFLRVSKMSEELKAQKEKRIKLNEPGFITVGKTRDNQRVRELGLKRNRAGYKIVPLQGLGASNVNSGVLSASSINGINKEQVIYKVQSELPVYWVGEYSVISGKIRQSYNPHVHKLNIQKEFLATYAEISNVFSKFYITPEYSSKYGVGHIIEDSYKIDIEGTCPYYIFEFQVLAKGFLNLNIDLPYFSGQFQGDTVRYAPIKYFLTRKKQPDANSPYLTGYQFYDGEYVKGYHKSLNRFLEINEGKYYIYVKIDNKKEKKAKSFAININTNATIRKFQRTEELTAEDQSEIIKSSFYEFSKQYGIRCYVHKEVKDLLVHICNKFDELGFSFIALYAHPNAKGELAMNVNRKKLLQYNIDLCGEAQNSLGDDSQDNYRLVAKPGFPEILVLERTVRSRSKEEQFPPEGAIDFYEIY